MPQPLYMTLILWYTKEGQYQFGLVRRKLSLSQGRLNYFNPRNSLIIKDPEKMNIEGIYVVGMAPPIPSLQAYLKELGI